MQASKRAITTAVSDEGRRPVGRFARLKQDLLAYAFLAPALTGLLLYIAVPLVSGLYLSFTRYAGVGSATWVGLRNYRVAFDLDPIFERALATTVGYTLVLVPTQLVLALGLALLLNRRVRGLRFLRTAYFVPYVVPWVAASLLFRSMFAPNGGANALLDLVGVGAPRWLQGNTFGSNVFWVVVLASLWKGLGFTMLVYLAALQDTPTELYGAAKIDGANRLQRFWSVTRPSIQPVSTFLFVIGVIASMQAFTPFLLIPAGGDFGSASLSTGLTNIPVYAYAQAFQGLHYGYAAAMLWVLGAILLAVSLLRLGIGEHGLQAEREG
jgi:ABC-type sugar transport system permease subunit